MKIDKNIPIPTNSKPTRGKYPFSEMNIGDSFEAPLEKAESARVASRNHGLVYNKKFTTKKTETGLRVWRVE